MPPRIHLIWTTFEETRIIKVSQVSNLWYFKLKYYFIGLIRIHSGNNYFICSVSEGKERWIADSKILDQELKQEEQEKVIVPAEFTDKHQDLKIEGKNNDPVLPDFIDNGGIKGHSEMYDYGEDFDCDNDGNKTGKLWLCLKLLNDFILINFHPLPISHNLWNKNFSVWRGVLWMLWR